MSSDYVTRDLQPGICLTLERLACGHLKGDLIEEVGQPSAVTGATDVTEHCRACAEISDARREMYNQFRDAATHEGVPAGDYTASEMIEAALEHGARSALSDAQNDIQAARLAAMGAQRDADAKYIRYQGSVITGIQEPRCSKLADDLLNSPLADAPAQKWLEERYMEQRNAARREQWVFVAGKMGRQYDEHFVFEDALAQQLDQAEAIGYARGMGDKQAACDEAETSSIEATWVHICEQTGFPRDGTSTLKEWLAQQLAGARADAYRMVYRLCPGLAVDGARWCEDRATEAEAQARKGGKDGA